MEEEKSSVVEKKTKEMKNKTTCVMDGRLRN